MAKVRLHSMLEELRGNIKGLVFRLSHNGKVSAYMSPDMSRVKWSAAQLAQRERMAAANAYAKAALADPQIRLLYEEMSLRIKNNKRPYDMAVMDYFAGSNLLGDKFRWDAELWRERMRYRRRRRR